MRWTLDRIHSTQKLHQLLINYLGGFVLHPVANIVEFEPSHEARETGTHLVNCQRIKFFQPVRLSPNEKRRLSDLRTFERGR